LRFKIGLHNRDLVLLNEIKNFFNGGIVTTGENSEIKFESLKELELIINHFDKYPLVTKN